MDRWVGMENQFADLSETTDLNEDQNKALDNLKRQRTGNSRPANIYNGILKSHLGYTIRGAIWYQGESNASRACQYRNLFPLMISNWRQEWGQSDFPFYGVQLADFKVENPEPAENDWADNPVCNMYDGAGLPMTPFRTDDWPGVTINSN